jgi:hypothetical protein
MLKDACHAGFQQQRWPPTAIEPCTGSAKDRDVVLVPCNLHLCFSSVPERDAVDRQIPDIPHVPKVRLPSSEACLLYCTCQTCAVESHAYRLP